MLQAQIYFKKDEMKGNETLRDFILNFLLKYEVAGATEFIGHSGFGANQQLVHPNSIFSFDEAPVLITFIDEEVKVRAVLTALKKEVNHTLIISSRVEMWD